MVCPRCGQEGSSQSGPTIVGVLYVKLLATFLLLQVLPLRLSALLGRLHARLPISDSEVDAADGFDPMRKGSEPPAVRKQSARSPAETDDRQRRPTVARMRLCSSDRSFGTDR